MLCLLRMYKGGPMAVKVGGREPFFRCQPLRAGLPPAGWSGLLMGGGRQRNQLRMRIWWEAISPTKLTHNSSRTREFRFKTASLMALNWGCGWGGAGGRAGGAGEQSTKREIKTFPSLAISKAEIIENQRPAGFGTCLSTFCSRLMPSFAFPWVCSSRFP